MHFVVSQNLTRLDIMFYEHYCYTVSNPRYQQVIHKENGIFEAFLCRKSVLLVDNYVDKSNNFIGYLVYIISEFFGLWKQIYNLYCLKDLTKGCTNVAVKDHYFWEAVS